MQDVGGHTSPSSAPGKLLAEQNVAQFRHGVFVHASDSQAGTPERVEVDPLCLVVGVTGHCHDPGAALGQAAKECCGQGEVPQMIDPEVELEAGLGPAMATAHAGVV